ncbi:MAG TPA: hypothetical protein PK350_08895 [Deltaproteobacteria bacterium]|nr:hypothetical protein [Deltaproteobacteria bacterium]HPR54311.1 hypothetical protein [Deltaproteobacteria bacterium]
MNRTKKDGTKIIGLYEHDQCRTRFYIELNEEMMFLYKGSCPKCHRHVELLPDRLYRSTDKARREYIQQARFESDPVYWSVWGTVQQ